MDVLFKYSIMFPWDSYNLPWYDFACISWFSISLVCDYIVSCELCCINLLCHSVSWIFCLLSRILYLVSPDRLCAHKTNHICKVFFGYNFKMQNTWTLVSISQKRFSTIFTICPSSYSRPFQNIVRGSKRFVVLQVLSIYSSQIRETHYIAWQLNGI